MSSWFSSKWARLIAGKKPWPPSELERHSVFIHDCNALQHFWNSNSSRSVEESIAFARTYLERLNFLLTDESRGPSPHNCVETAASSRIFVTVALISLAYHDDDLVRSAAIFFNHIIHAGVLKTEEESERGRGRPKESISTAFSRALVDLVRQADKTSDKTETLLVELLFGIANNIRLQPETLSTWFRPRVTPVRSDTESTGPSGAEFAGATRKDEFPLFYMLVDYVHSDKSAGDFARTGLLYIIETASRSKSLERWLIESDLATLMAIGLGALYSQLGSLEYIPTDDDVPRVVALSDHAKEETALQPTLSEAMDTFMSYLLFWQDTIDHCKSAEVNDTLLDHFQVLFLEQLLYPSLLESSDVAGGSTAAVLTYLCRILDSVEQGELVHRILHFLLASSPPPEQQMDMSASRRKSINVLAALSSEAAQPSPSLFNLRDLALLGLQSANRQTVLATLRLLNVVLQRHHPFARSLIHTIPSQPARQRSIGAFNAELEHLLGLATSIFTESSLNESYDNYVADATWVLESRLCLPVSDEEAEKVVPLPQQLQQDDPIVQGLLTCLDTFFTNSVIVNLALTGVFMSLASSHLFALDGWVLVDPACYDKPSSESSDTIDQVRQAYQVPTWPETAAPTLTLALQKLVEQVRQWQKDLPDFDVLVAARRELLHQGDRPQTPTPVRSREASEPPVPGSVDRSRPSFPGSPESSLPGSRGRSPNNIGSPAMNPSAMAMRGESVARPDESRGSSTSRTVTAEALRRRLATPFPPAVTATGSTPTDAEPVGASDEASGEATANAEETDSPGATLGHVLTNVVILYEFLLELSAVVQARGSLFEEAGYQ
ncbi:hypothetical protein N7481_003342 [Penicillium waksmanii]|uniref:uncharacterized protein n=1 Tax=Penicillium waksmanii TaxID=69791 RepID=UPI0025488F63|nr:uncharacterized protein N7481_003342 [Penicillium waksmanii]KAJ5988132.1 hypothetical protein N7481_003342 [Penicillium waksmanii]